MYERIEINPFLYGSFQSILYYSARYKFLDNVFPPLAQKLRERRRLNEGIDIGQGRTLTREFRVALK